MFGRGTEQLFRSSPRSIEEDRRTNAINGVENYRGLSNPNRDCPMNHGRALALLEDARHSLLHRRLLLCTFPGFQRLQSRNFSREKHLQRRARLVD